MNAPARRCPLGLTLVETMFSVLIMAIIIVMAMHAFGQMVKSRQTTNARLLATSLANQLMSEIVQNGYCDAGGGGSIGPDSGESTRASFDDVDDYNGLAESPPVLRDGSAIGNAAGWTRQSAVEFVNPTTLASSVGDQGLKRITVTVTDPRGVRTSVVALRSAEGAFSQSPGGTVQAVRWIGIEIQLGDEPTNRMFGGAAISSIVAGD